MLILGLTDKHCLVYFNKNQHFWINRNIIHTFPRYLSNKALGTLDKLHETSKTKILQLFYEKTRRYYQDLYYFRSINRIFNKLVLKNIEFLMSDDSVIVDMGIEIISKDMSFNENLVEIKRNQ